MPNLLYFQCSGLRGDTGMAKELKTIDITNIPELVRLAEEVRTSNEPRVLRCANEDVAVVMPPKPARTSRRGRRPSAADYEAFRSAAGGWKDVDTEAFKEYIYERRRRSSRPPVEL